MPPLARDDDYDISSDEETAEVEIIGDDKSNDEWLVEYTDPDD